MSSQVERAKSTIKGVIAPETAALQENGAVTAPLGSSENPSNAILTVANFITFCRFVLTIVFLVLFINHDSQFRIPALACYAIAATTDFLDGQIARRTQTVSWLGKIMDPIMDRVLLFTGVLGLMITGDLPVWVAAFVILRDVYLGGAALVLRRYHTRPLDVIYIGKVATALLMTGFVDLLMGEPVVPGLGITDIGWLPGFNHSPVAIGIFLVYIGIVCSAIAAVTYTRSGLRIRKEVLSSRMGA